MFLAVALTREYGLPAAWGQLLATRKRVERRDGLLPSNGRQQPIIDNKALNALLHLMLSPTFDAGICLPPVLPSCRDSIDPALLSVQRYGCREQA